MNEVGLQKRTWFVETKRSGFTKRSVSNETKRITERDWVTIHGISSVPGKRGPSSAGPSQTLRSPSGWPVQRNQAPVDKTIT